MLPKARVGKLLYLFLYLLAKVMEQSAAAIAQQAVIPRAAV